MNLLFFHHLICNLMRVARRRQLFLTFNSSPTKRLWSSHSFPVDCSTWANSAQSDSVGHTFINCLTVFTYSQLHSALNTLFLHYSCVSFHVTTSSWLDLFLFCCHYQQIAQQQAQRPLLLAVICARTKRQQNRAVSRESGDVCKTWKVFRRSARPGHKSVAFVCELESDANHLLPIEWIRQRRRLFGKTFFVTGNCHAAVNQHSSFNLSQNNLSFR